MFRFISNLTNIALIVVSYHNINEIKIFYTIHIIYSVLEYFREELYI